MRSRCPYCGLPQHRLTHGPLRGIAFGLPLSLAAWWTIATLIRLALELPL